MKNSRIAHAMQFVGDDLIAEACTHTSPRHSRLLLAAACAALVLLGGVGCACIAPIGEPGPRRASRRQT